MKATLAPTPPFDLHATARHQTYYQPQFGADAYRDGAYYRALDVDGHLLLAVVRATGTVDAPELAVGLRGDTLSSAAVEAAAQTVARILALNLDLRPFYAVAREDPFLSQAVRSFYGLHPPQTASILEALVMAITGQQISGSVARAIRARIVRELGTPFTVDGDTFHTFPNATDLLAAGQERLRALGLSTRKAEYILDIAARVADGLLDMGRLRGLGNQEVMDELVRLRGIGPWTAQWVLLRALGRSDVFPAGDLALRRALSEHYFGGRPIGVEDADAFAQERWGAYAGLATTYLFAHIRHQRVMKGGPELVQGA